MSKEESVSIVEGTFETMSPKVTWTLCPYAPGDERLATRLFADVFGKEISREHYRWKFLDSGWSHAGKNIWYARVDSNIVGQFAGVPMRFHLRDEVLDVLQGCDVMTAPSYRRQGILGALGAAAIESWKTAGVAFVTGLENEVWGSRRETLNFRVQFQIVSLWRPLRLSSLLVRRSVFRPIASVIDAGVRVAAAGLDSWNRRGIAEVDVTPVDEPGPEFDVLWNDMRKLYEAAVVRDRAWITHRYARAPGRPYRIFLATVKGKPAGYLVLRDDTDSSQSVRIADVFAAPHDRVTRRALVTTAISLLQERGVEGVHVFLPKRSPIVAEFRRMGFLAATAAYNVVVIPAAMQSPDDALSDPTRWFTTAGDFDIV